MIDIVNIFICIILAIIAIQDIKYRMVSTVLLPILLVSSFINFKLQLNNWLTLSMNIGFITILISILFLYISIKLKRLTNIFKSYFGIGDVLFLYAVSPLFSINNLVVFIIIGMFLSLLIHLSIQAITIDSDITVPLAGYLAIVLILVFICDVFIEFNLFHSNVL